MNNQTVAFIAIVTVFALVFTAAIVTQEADARRRSSTHQTSSQGCVNENARCQNVNSQNSGHNIGSVVIGNQPVTLPID